MALKLPGRPTVRFRQVPVNRVDKIVTKGAPVRRFRWLVRGFLVALLAASVPGAATAGRAATPAADVAKIRKLLENRQFASLTSLLEGYQAACDRDIGYEFAVQNGFLALADRAPANKALLDEWVRRFPGVWVPLTARATWYKTRGRAAPGGRGAGGATAESAGMGDDFARAVDDLKTSLKLRPRQLYGYLILMEISQAIGDQERGTLLARQALALYPDSYLVRHRRMTALLPRWGGSYDAMEQFAAESAPFAARNSRLRALRGLIPWDQGRVAASEGDFPKAVALFENALTYGVTTTVLYDLADTYVRGTMYDKALATLDRAAAMQPDAAEEHALRSKIAFAQGNLDEALAHLDRMEEIQGLTAGEASETRIWESRRLVADGHALFRRKDLPGAIDRYTAAIRVHAGNADAWCWRGIAYDRSGRPEGALADLRQAIAIDPRLYSAYKGLDDVLYRQGRIDEIVESWSRYLRLEPGNDNAYVDRSGAYLRKKDKASAIGDLTRACGMGNDQACYLLKSLPGVPRR